MFIYNLPPELMDRVVAFAVRRYCRPSWSKPKTAIEIDLKTCRTITEINHDYNSKFWWASGVHRVISTTYMEQFLRLTNYVLFEVVEDVNDPHATEYCYLQLFAMVTETVNSLCVFDRGGTSPKAKCLQLEASLKLEFNSIVSTIEPGRRELFQAFVTRVFRHLLCKTSCFSSKAGGDSTS